MPVAVIAKKMRNEETPTAHLGLWCARRAFAFAAISVAYPNDEDQMVAINLKGAFQRLLPTRSPASRTQIANEKSNKNNEVRVRTITFIAICSRYFGGQSVVGEIRSLRPSSGFLLCGLQIRTLPR